MTGELAFQAALCWLQLDKPDLSLVHAWLSRAVELRFGPAERLLRALQAAQAGAHSPAQHCHELGEGRRVCHGGAALAPVAAAPTN